MSPVSNQLKLASQPNLADLIPEYYGEGLFPVLLCPPALFAEIIRINDLRANAASRPGVSEPVGVQCLEQAGLGILQRILDFSPQRWTDVNQEKHHIQGDLWLLLGGLYQSTVAMYCLSSLQSLAVLPYSTHLVGLRAKHKSSLFSELKRALISPELKMWVMWPLVVAGMVADDDHDMRRFVSSELRKMAGNLGTPIPLLARSTLDGFWRKRGRGWDECFDGPYAFVT